MFEAVLADTSGNFALISRHLDSEPARRALLTELLAHHPATSSPELRRDIFVAALPHYRDELVQEYALRTLSEPEFHGSVAVILSARDILMRAAKGLSPGHVPRLESLARAETHALGSDEPVPPHVQAAQDILSSLPMRAQRSLIMRRLALDWDTSVRG